MRNVRYALLILLLCLLLTMPLAALAQESPTPPPLATNTPADATAEATPAPDITPEATAPVEPTPVIVVVDPPDVPAPTVEDVTDAYKTALNALITVVLSVLAVGGGVAGLAIWKYAPVVLAILEFLAKLTATKADDEAVAALRGELIRLGYLPDAAGGIG